MKDSTSDQKDFFSNVKIISLTFLLLLLIPFIGSQGYAQKVYSHSVAYSSAAIDIKGNLYVWGFDQYLHKVVTSQTNQDSTPVMVSFPSGVTKWISIAAGQAHMIALADDGNLYAWGLNNHGQLGDSTTQNDSALVMVTKPAGVSSWTAVDCGAFHNIALGNDGNVYVWGFNSQGQLADSALNDKLVPTKIDLPGGITAKAVSASSNTCVAIGNNDTVYDWGKNGNGQLGNNTQTDRVTPQSANLPTGITPVSLTSGAFFNSCLGSDGNIYAWGQANNGQIGNGNASGNVLVPTAANKPAGVTKWKSYACGASFVLAIGDNDSLYAWGYGGTGEMGNGSKTGNNPDPVKPSLPSGVVPVDVAAGHNYGLVVDQISNVYSWGRNSEGELGINSLVSTETSPIKVSGEGGIGNLILPVELTSFTAASSSEGVLLTWKTATEVNNSGFQVERSSDNKSFIKIGFVKGNGTSAKENSYSYLDKNTTGKAFYRLNQIDFDGTSMYSKIIEINFIQPLVYNLEQNYPNPFNPSTIISYNIPKDGFISLKVYNILGEEVAKLYEGFQKAGSFHINFNASKLASGIYLYKLQSGNFTETKKMLLLK